MTQASLDFTRRLRPIAATADPATSHEAARHLARTGQLTRSMRRTLTVLAAWPASPPTSHELAGRDLRDRYEHARRLADLRERGLVTNGAARACGITGKQAVTWLVTAAGRAALGGRA